MDSSHDDVPWVAQEPPLGPALRRRIVRLVQRGGASWFIWVPLAVLLSAYVARRDVHRRSFEATVALRVTEGGVKDVQADGIDLGTGRLRTYVEGRAFSSDHLVELMSRHRRQFSDVVTEPAESVHDMRSAIDVTITSNDFIADRGPEDPPRSARIAITFHAGDPEFALTIARELADLVVASTLSLEEQALARAEAATATALGEAEGAVDQTAEERARAAAAAANEPPGPEARRGSEDHLADAARARLSATVMLAARARLAGKARAERRMLQFDVVDVGQAPPARNASFFTRRLAIMLALALLAGLLLGGAFDPRILDRHDLVALGITTLSETPALPRPSTPSPESERRAQPAPSTGE
jgi:hypothetical protein